MENNIVNEQIEIINSIITLDYEQTTEESISLTKLVSKTDFGVTVFLAYGFALASGVLALSLSKDKSILLIMGLVVAIPSLLAIIVLILAKVNLLKAAKKTKLCHIKFDLYDDKLRFEVREGETFINTVFDYSDFKKLYLKNIWIIVKTKASYIFIKAEDKRDDVVNFLVSKNPKIKVVHK